MVKISIPLLLLATLLERGDAAGNEEEVLIDNVGVLSQTAPNTTSYQCTFRNLWSKKTHPKNYPKELARWGSPTMWTHTLQFTPWSSGNVVTRGVEKVAEDGFADTLIQEMEQQGEQVQAYSDDPGFFTSQQDFVHMPPIETSFQYPFLSAIAGMSPSPDWYTGFYSFWLIDEFSRTWYDHIKIQTYAWDAGTDAGSTYDSLVSDLDPPLEIQRFVPNNAPEGGELRGPDGESVPVVAEWECFLIVGDEPFAMPDCDYFANPCCNETDTKNCGARLPNGSPPKLSPEYEGIQSDRGIDTANGSGAMQHFSLVALMVGMSAMQCILA